MAFSRFFGISAFALLLILSARPGQAALLNGETVETSYLYPDTVTTYAGPTNSVVLPGLELASFAGFVDIDFSDTNILITTTRDAGVNLVAFDGLLFRDVNGTIPVFASVSLNAATNYAGFDLSRITFDGDHIFVNVAGLAGLSGQVISLDLNVEDVPEPASLGLVFMGLLVVAGLRKFATS